MLCPHCCSSDMFVRSAAAHAFHRDEVEACSASDMLHCSRYHIMPSSDVSVGCLIKFNQEYMPLMFPGAVKQLQGLDWSMVCGGGVLGACMDDGAASSSEDDPIVHSNSEGEAQAEGGASTADAAGMQHLRLLESVQGQRQPQSAREWSEGYQAGTFLAMSFFVETGQVGAGDCLHSEELVRFQALVAECSQEAVQTYTHTLRLSDDREVQLQFRFKVGDTPATSDGRKIESIHAPDVGDALGSSPSLSSFSCCDNVLVIYEKRGNDKRNQFTLFPGNRNNLRLCRLTAAARGSSREAAECWSELQDYFAIVLGPEFQNYEITALTLYRNDERADAFMRQMRGMQQRRRKGLPPWEDRGRVAAEAVAALGGGVCAQYSAVFERGQFDWVRARMMSDGALRKELERLGVGKEHREQVLECVKQLQYTFDAQEATMRHFKDHAGKFGLLPEGENEDVNLTLAWWGNSRGNAV